ncbi:MAG: PIG-L family deacetylase [Oceanospirillaceae bacterium]|nr:PIG-L family deacetylase [Oceanospirillaceae bacterium]MCP5334550.1 PIG-L family deacetylase [Oceanospirillaceae bacterium]
MFLEHSLIPFKTSQLPEGHWLVVAPHPDDEIIGMGGALALAAANCQRVTVVYLTSGDKGGDATVRQQEALAVCAELNAKAVFLGLPDRGVSCHDEQVTALHAVLQEVKPDVVFFPSPEEFHPDHRAASVLTWTALQKTHFRGQVFHYEISRQGEANVLLDISAVIQEKLRLLNFYQSQLSQNNYVQVMQGINVARTYTLPEQVKAAEAFYAYASATGRLQGHMRERAFIQLSDSQPGDRPVVSILIRTKDRPDTLIRAVESVKSQTYRSYIDLVVVNDGGCAVDSVLAPYQNDFWRLNLVNLPVSRGRAAAANLGLNQAKGQFVNFLDDDDELDADHVQIFLANWRRNNDIEVFYRGVRVVSPQGELLREYNEPYDPGLLMHTNYIPIHAVTFSRRFIDIGCRFDESLEFFEDWDFWIQLSRLTRFHRDQKITATYNMTGNSAASPHMHAVLDVASHMNRVRDKWAVKWTAVESNRIVASVSRRAKEG